MFYNPVAKIVAIGRVVQLTPFGATETEIGKNNNIKNLLSFFSKILRDNT